MNIRIVPIDQINAAAYPRVNLQPGDVKHEKLRCSIEELGFVEPFVWNDRIGHVVGGHQPTWAQCLQADDL